MLLSLSAAGANTYTLSAGGKIVGSLQGRTLHIGGFDSEDEALAAGDAGYVALARWVGLRRGRLVSDPPPVHVVAAHDGSLEWIAADGHCVARLIPANDVEGPSVEFALPDGLLMAVAVGAVAQICEAMLEPSRRAGWRHSLASSAAHATVAGAIKDMCVT